VLVAVMDQEMHGRLAFLELPDHLACLLRDPRPIGMRCTVSKVHALGLQLEEDAPQF
jgi:hypothetical protein